MGRAPWGWLIAAPVLDVLPVGEGMGEATTPFATRFHSEVAP